MSDEPKDYGEPWTHEGFRVWNGEDRLIAEIWNASDEHGNRIVACVNACAGIDDPSAEIARLRADVARLENAIKVFAQSPGRDARVLFAALADTADKPNEGG